MAAKINPQLDEAIKHIIQQDKLLTDKSKLLMDLSLINDENIPNSKKIASFESLIKYISYLPKWDDELIEYLGNRFTQIKVREIE